MKFPVHCFLIGLLSAVTVSAQYNGWQHSGLVAVVTAPEGANIPAGVTVENFPLLVRLDKDFFDFKQAKSDGADLRFSAEGKALAYQIEQWDAEKGTASIWVLMPKIKGNERQALKVFWGKADAVGESDGRKVFNESNGYASVYHMAEPVTDDAGATEPKDQGTTATEGIVGQARHFEEKKGFSAATRSPVIRRGWGR